MLSQEKLALIVVKKMQDRILNRYVVIYARFRQEKLQNEKDK